MQGWIHAALEFKPRPGQDIEEACEQALLVLDSGIVDPFRKPKLWMDYNGVPVLITPDKLVKDLVKEYHRAAGIEEEAELEGVTP